MSFGLTALFTETEEGSYRSRCAEAVQRLATVALCDTSGGFAAAQVLLSAYNGQNWQLAITDLSLLDPGLLDRSLLVISARARFGIEPHTLIDNGDRLFNRLGSKWQRYRIDNRYKTECRECYGSGEVFANLDDDNDDTMKTCPDCNGARYQ